MNVRCAFPSRAGFATLHLCGWLILGLGTGSAQTYDFGYVPIGATNRANGFNFIGGADNGTNKFMVTEMFIGPNAADFMTSSNYAGQTLPPGPFYFYSLSFLPHAIGFETTALTNFATPSPPFGAGITYLQGVGAPTNRPGSGPIVPELAPLESAMTNFLAAYNFEAGTLALMHDSKLVFRQGYGWRDTNFTAVIHPDNLFRLASVSKTITASAIYKLIGAGKFTTNTTILNDRVIDPTRQFSLELISASGGAWLGDKVTTVVSILDTNTPPNFIGQPVFLPSGNFQLQFLCSTGLVLTVEYSTNLSNWQPLQTFTNATAVTTFTDTNANSRVNSFYRVAVP